MGHTLGMSSFIPNPTCLCRYSCLWGCQKNDVFTAAGSARHIASCETRLGFGLQVQFNSETIFCQVQSLQKLLFLLTICVILWNLIASTVVLNATCFHRLVCTFNYYVNGLVLYHPQIRFRVRGGEERERHCTVICISLFTRKGPVTCV